MRFSDADNCSQAFKEHYYEGDQLARLSKELDAWCDAIDKDRGWDKLQKMMPNSVELRSSDDIVEAEAFFKQIAARNDIDIGGHSGTSFRCLTHDIFDIAKAGGRDAFIQDRVKGAGNSLAKDAEGPQPKKLRP